jgi:hypothetical protein
MISQEDVKEMKNHFEVVRQSCQKYEEITNIMCSCLSEIRDNSTDEIARNFAESALDKVINLMKASNEEGESK